MGKAEYDSLHARRQNAVGAESARRSGPGGLAEYTGRTNSSGNENRSIRLAGGWFADPSRTDAAKLQVANCRCAAAPDRSRDGLHIGRAGFGADERGRSRIRSEDQSCLSLLEARESREIPAK